jgi:hypothetical protein
VSPTLAAPAHFGLGPSEGAAVQSMSPRAGRPEEGVAVRSMSAPPATRPEEGVAVRSISH